MRNGVGLVKLLTLPMLFQTITENREVVTFYIWFVKLRKALITTGIMQRRSKFLAKTRTSEIKQISYVRSRIRFSTESNQRYQIGIWSSFANCTTHKGLFRHIKGSSANNWLTRCQNNVTGRDIIRLCLRCDLSLRQTLNPIQKSLYMLTHSQCIHWFVDLRVFSNDNKKQHHVNHHEKAIKWYSGRYQCWLSAYKTV